MGEWSPSTNSDAAAGDNSTISTTMDGYEAIREYQVPVFPDTLSKGWIPKLLDKAQEANEVLATDTGHEDEPTSEKQGLCEAQSELISLQSTPPYVVKH
jgi:hypothetical protein